MLRPTATIRLNRVAARHLTPAREVVVLQDDLRRLPKPELGAARLDLVARDDTEGRSAPVVLHALPHIVRHHRSGTFIIFRVVQIVAGHAVACEATNWSKRARFCDLRCLVRRTEGGRGAVELELQ